MSIIVHQDKCKGCGLCVKNCPFDAMLMADNVPVIGDKCTECGACLETCRFDALEQTKVEKKSVQNIEDYHDVWVFAEQRDNHLMPVVVELLGEAKRLASEIGCRVCAIVCGMNIEQLTNDLIGYGVDVVYYADRPELKHYTTDAYTKVIYEAVEKYKPEILLMGATHIGRDLGPSIAVKCRTGLTADCTKLEIDPVDKKLLQTRPAFGGNLMATIICEHNRPQMATVRPGIMQKAEYVRHGHGERIELEVEFSDDEIRERVLQIVKSAREAVSLTDAEIIVSGGLGMGSRENFRLLYRLADRLGAAVGASRAAVAAGYASYPHQVGQTGATVSPRLYLALGISGAVQHVSGILQAETIVAVNRDRNAPIHQYSDYSVCTDCVDFVRALLQKLEGPTR